jgi:hypothetical protein
VDYLTISIRRTPGRGVAGEKVAQQASKEVLSLERPQSEPSQADPYELACTFSNGPFLSCLRARLEAFYLQDISIMH